MSGGSVKFFSPKRERLGPWKLLEVHTGHCPGKCYWFDDGNRVYHIPAADFWGVAAKAEAS